MGNGGAGGLDRSIWGVLTLLFAALVIGLAVSDFRFAADDHFRTCAGMIVLLLVGARLSRICGYAAPALMAEAIAPLTLLFLLAPALTYILAAAGFPYQDAALAAVDAALGLDWPAHYAFVCQRPWLIAYLYLGYAMIIWPMLGIPVLLGAAGHARRLQRFTLACIVTVAVTAVISAFMPAIGTYHHYGLTPDHDILRPSGYLVQLDQLPKIRDGSLRLLETGRLGGIITFPSFHASAAILSMWGLWSLWWARPLAVIANLAMLLATPLIGGHHFVDVIAGIGVASAAIAVTGRLGQPAQVIIHHHAGGLADAEAPT